MIKRMLVIRPEGRISLPEILCHPWLRHILGPDGLPLDGGTEDDDAARQDDCLLAMNHTASDRDASTAPPAAKCPLAPTVAAWLRGVRYSHDPCSAATA